MFAFVWTICWFASPIQILAKFKPQIDTPKCGSNEVVQFKQLLDFRLDGRNASFLSIMLTPPPQHTHTTNQLMLSLSNCLLLTSRDLWESVS